MIFGVGPIWSTNHCIDNYHERDQVRDQSMLLESTLGLCPEPFSEFLTSLAPFSLELGLINLIDGLAKLPHPVLDFGICGSRIAVDFMSFRI